MHITLETDYAIRIIDCLAKKGSRMDAKTISESTKISLRFSLKILRKLVSGNIVRSYKGINGGYEFCADIKKLSLYDIVELVEGTYMFSRCLDEEYTCNRELPCGYQHAFMEISNVVCEELKKMTFDKFL